MFAKDTPKNVKWEILDSVSGFEPACNTHDVCYAVCSRHRSECADAFLSNLLKICKTTGNNWKCLALAKAYRGILDVGGLDACLVTRDTRCQGDEEARQLCSK